jgi:hypothetical protein
MLSQILKSEVERLFRNRTPPKSVDEVDWRYRVPRTEVRSIAQSLGLELHELDCDWSTEYGQWYTAMASRVLQELDPNWKETWNRFPRGRRTKFVIDRVQ